MKAQERISSVPRECKDCGCPETEAMKKRSAPFAIPLCDECIYKESHAGHVPNMQVTIDHVMQSRDESGRLVDKRDSKTIRYADWDARCRKCLPY